MGTFGNTEINTDQYINIMNDIRGSSATLSENGRAESITVALKWWYGDWTGKVRCAIYRSDQSLLAETEERTLTLTGTLTWYTFNFVGDSPELIVGTYYLVVWAEVGSGTGATMAGKYPSIESACNQSLVYSSDEFPDPGEMSIAENNIMWDIYCTYSPTPIHSVMNVMGRGLDARRRIGFRRTLRDSQI
jgi:hypothetical protein